jgi:hypothetical protein
MNERTKALELFRLDNLIMDWAVDLKVEHSDQRWDKTWVHPEKDSEERHQSQILKMLIC